MFAFTSRYYTLETIIYVTPDGQEIAYKSRRFLPIDPAPVLLAEHTVTEGERLDNITARYLSDPEQFWRVCDSNDAMHPAELTAEIGRRLRITMPQP
jgi:hypothetical protein